LQDLLPGIIQQLGPDNLEDLKRIYADLSAAGGMPGLGDAAGADDDDVPELVDNFDDVAAKDDGMPDLD
jgi:nascent polypeptide-associated complex subunit beta